MTFFEAPHRIVQTLRMAADVLGRRPMAVGRELTKLHQEFLRGSASELADRLENHAKGEFTVVIGPMTENVADHARPSDDSVASAFGLITETGLGSRRETLAATAKRLRMSVKDVYAAVERHKSANRQK
jgi:16S rRNA (cytidine1402-2'-O)-methyltransferase